MKILAFLLFSFLLLNSAQAEDPKLNYPLDPEINYPMDDAHGEA